MYYYHGSSNDIKNDYIYPKSSNVVNGEKKVFATNTKGLALIFMGEKWKDSDMWLGSEKNKIYAIELLPGIFKDTFSGKDGYLYYLSPNDFHSDLRLGMKNHEFIADKKQKILKKIYIKDVLQAIKRDGTINLISYKKWITCCTK